MCTRTVSLVPLRVGSNLLSRREESHKRRGEKGRGGERKKGKEKRKKIPFVQHSLPFHWYKSKVKFKPTCECGGTKEQTAASRRFNTLLSTQETATHSNLTQPFTSRTFTEYLLWANNVLGIQNTTGFTGKDLTLHELSAGRQIVKKKKKTRWGNKYCACHLVI